MDKMESEESPFYGNVGGYIFNKAQFAKLNGEWYNRLPNGDNKDYIDNHERRLEAGLGSVHEDSCHQEHSGSSPNFASDDEMSESN